MDKHLYNTYKIMGIAFSNIELAKTEAKQHSDKIRETVFVSITRYGDNQSEYILKTIGQIIFPEGASIVYTAKYKFKNNVKNKLTINK